LSAARGRALALVASGKEVLPDLPERQRTVLALVADGVVGRYV
jgi:hypothetical protein